MALGKGNLPSGKRTTHDRERNPPDVQDGPDGAADGNPVGAGPTHSRKELLNDETSQNHLNPVAWGDGLFGDQGTSAAWWKFAAI